MVSVHSHVCAFCSFSSFRCLSSILLTISVSVSYLSRPSLCSLPQLENNLTSAFPLYAIATRVRPLEARFFLPGFCSPHFRHLFSFSCAFTHLGYPDTYPYSPRNTRTLFALCQLIVVSSNNPPSNLSLCYIPCFMRFFARQPPAHFITITINTLKSHPQNPLFSLFVRKLFQVHER